MSNPFKIGDIVKYVGTSGKYINGGVYEIVGFHDQDNLKLKGYEEQNDNKYTRFRLVESKTTPVKKDGDMKGWGF